MSSSRTVPAQPAESPTRMEAARARLTAARRGITIAAFASFGVGLALVRASHPAVTHGSPQGLAAPASLVAEIQGLEPRRRLDRVRVRHSASDDVDLVNRQVFRAMGCEVVVAGADDRALEAIKRLFEQRDATFSRFRPGSELVKVNSTTSARRSSLAGLRRGGDRRSRRRPADRRARRSDRRRSDRSDRLRHGLRRARRRSTAGRARSSQRLATDPRGRRRAHPPAGNGPRPERSRQSDDRRQRCRDFSANQGSLSAGGDIAARGLPVTVALPDGGAVTLEAGGIATSGSSTRRWLRGGVLQHHLVDPRTSLPSTSPWTHVTAVGRDCLSADIAAKAGFLLGEDGPGWLDERGVAARFVGIDGAVENGRWARSVDREPAWA